MEAIDDFKVMLGRKLKVLTELRDLSVEFEQVRLSGKIEGLKIAITDIEALYDCLE